MGKSILFRRYVTVLLVLSILSLFISLTNSDKVRHSKHVRKSDRRRYRSGDLVLLQNNTLVDNLSEIPVTNLTTSFVKKKKRKRRKKKKEVQEQTTIGPIVERSTIIRTGPEDDTSLQMIVEQRSPNSKPKVTYYTKYPYRNRRPTHFPKNVHYELSDDEVYSNYSRIEIIPEGPLFINQTRYGNDSKRYRYDGTYRNWMGLRYGCGCHILGSGQPTCDIVSGQCHCRSNVTGRACDRCLTNHWGLSSGAGCVPCNCNTTGSLNGSCHIDTGQCICKAGVGGQYCNQCLPGHYGFSNTGCPKCSECNSEGHICHPDTGRCVCPTNTHGAKCQTCVSDTWGYDKHRGCQDCGCEAGGSIKSQCDLVTGICECRSGFTGDKCDKCDHGYHGYPLCKSCDCDDAGTVGVTCDKSGRCSCDEVGTCTCKSNVIGDRCDQCKPGTFGLQVDNPDGCTACFCFGRAAACTQAGLQWRQIRHGRPRTVTIEYDPSPPFKNTLPIDTQEICYINLAIPGGSEVTWNGADSGLNITNNLRTIPGDTGDVKIGVSFLFDTPVYWQLPSPFLGDKILSYGGFLRFTVETEGGDTKLPPGVLATYPLIQLQGNNKLVLEHFPLLPSPTGTYEVRFHESLWQEKSPNRKVTREMLMVALQNVQHILIRASDSVDFTKVTLRDVSLDTASVAHGMPLAGGVELCECPKQYNSTSCQDPSIGFFRWYDKNSSGATILIQLIGEAKPCECNTRSDICDIETGYCLDCANNTGGPSCERCKDGFYGDPNLSSCSPCPCPSIHRNFASSCIVIPGRDLVCSCKQGYTGKHCDRCAYGWYGYPEQEGGSCTPCECDQFGSVSDECHEKTGQCNCRPGIEGRDCSICPRREIMTSTGCSTCEQDCTGILLKDIDNLTLLTERETSHLSEGVGPPYERLYQLENNVTSLQRTFDGWIQMSDEFRDISTSHLQHTTRDVHSKAEAVKNQCTKLSDTAAIYKEESIDLLNGIKKLDDEAKQAVNSLNDYAHGDTHEFSVSAAIMESRRLLDKIRMRDFYHVKDKAEDVLDYCTGVLDKVMKLRPNYPEMTIIVEEINKLTMSLDEMDNYIKENKDQVEKISKKSTESSKRYQKLNQDVRKLNHDQQTIDQLHHEGRNYVDEGEISLEKTREHLKNLTEMKQNLKNTSLVLERQEGILYGLNPLYRTKYVKPAQHHANMLWMKSLQYREWLNSSRKHAHFALDASKAYQDIVDALDSAREAAQHANVAANITYRKAYPLSNEDSLLEQSSISKSLSSRLENKAILQSQRVQDMKEKLNNETEAVNVLNETIRKTEIADRSLGIELRKLEDQKVGEKVQLALEKVKNLNTKLIEAKDTVSKINRDVENKLRPKLASLTSEAKDLNLDKARVDIMKSLENVRRADDLLNDLVTRETVHSQLLRKRNETFFNNLTKLKNQILEAKHSAAGVRLSLSSSLKKGCVRSYRVPSLQPATANKLVITLTLNSNQTSGLILYLASSSTTDYIAVEIVNKVVRFIWKLGGEAGVVSKPLNDDPAYKQTSSQWYKIVIERISYSSKLWVLPGGFPTDSIPPATNSSDTSYTRFDIGPNDRVWVGGTPPTQDKPPELTQLPQGLIGCLHSITIDDRKVGLWNFYQDDLDGCQACIEKAEATPSEVVSSFNGDGYSVLKHDSRSPYNKYGFTVSLRFKTYDENALLFLALSEDKERSTFISLKLKNGRAVFQIGYRGEAQLEMRSTGTYNDGNWTQLDARRHFDRKKKVEKGVLRVGEEELLGAPAPPPSEDQIPNLAGADYLIGGVPPGYNHSLSLPQSFLGCMSDLTVEGDKYNPLKGRNHGVGNICSDRVTRIAGFHGKGYLQLEGTPLRSKTIFGLSLRTLQADGLVLLANGQPIKGSIVDHEFEEISNNVLQQDKGDSYYSVSLADGRVEVRVEAGKGPVTLVSQALCNEGRFHSIFVTKTGRKIEMRVDDELQATSTLPEGATVVKVKDLYLGGVPSFVDATKFVADSTSLVGTIKEVLFDNTLQRFDKPVSFSDVGIGRVGPERGVDSIPPTLPRVTPPPHSGCRRPRNYVLEQGAVKFGDAPNSHTQVSLRRRGVFNKDFSIQLDFRTFYPNGLFFMVPGNRGKHKQYLYVTLRNGQILVVLVRSKKKFELTTPHKLNDGIWHRLLIERIEKRLTLKVDREEKTQLKRLKKIHVGNIVYIGGLPENDLLLPDYLVSKSEGFKGCIRNLKVSNQTEDLVGDKSSHERVGQCFPSVERGSFFHGDAYAIYKKDFFVESMLEIELEFRTSELNGIILTVSDYKGYPAVSLEINNGKILLSGDIGDRRPFRVEQGFASPFGVCDNKWHKVQAMYIKDELTLRVDQLNQKYALQRNVHLLNTTINGPLYIGGLPDRVSGGSLETTENFKGCIRHLTIGGTRRDWTDMDSLHNVMLGSCPSINN